MYGISLHQSIYLHARIKHARVCAQYIYKLSSSENYHDENEEMYKEVNKFLFFGLLAVTFEIFSL